MDDENCRLIVERNSDMGIAEILSVVDQNIAFLCVFADNEARETSFRSVVHRIVQLCMPATSNRLEYCKEGPSLALPSFRSRRCDGAIMYARFAQKRCNVILSRSFRLVRPIATFIYMILKQIDSAGIQS